MPPTDMDFSGPSVRHHKQQHKKLKQQESSPGSVKKDKTNDSKSIHNNSKSVHNNNKYVHNNSKSVHNNKTIFSDERDSTALPEAANITAKQSKQSHGHESIVQDDVKKDQPDKDLANTEGSSTKTKKKRRQKPRVIFNPEDDCKKSSKLSYVDEDDETDSGIDNTEESNDKISEDLKSEDEKSSVAKTLSDVATQQQFADSYQTSEFRPYNPLPHALEERLFPRPVGPANFFDYPSWPDKTECLDVVENLSSWVKSSRMDIDITQRGHK